MKLIIDDINDAFQDLCKKSKSVNIAVFAFSPDEEIMKSLLKLKHVRLIISKEFNVNNPYKLEKLNLKNIRGISPCDGRLHAKIYIFYLRTGITKVLLGSANLSHQAFNYNQEICLLLNSKLKVDGRIINRLEKWFDELYNKGSKIDLNEAKEIFNNQPRLSIDAMNGHKEIKRKKRYWVLKTTAGKSGKDYWEQFLLEGVIAIGWKIDSNPNKFIDIETLRKEIQRNHPDNQDERAPNKVYNFINVMRGGDLVVICKGYFAHPPKTDVYLYGVAQIKEDRCYKDKKSDWWELKRKVDIVPIEQYIPKNIMVKTLKKGTMMETIHKIDKSKYNRLKERLRDEFDITW